MKSSLFIVPSVGLALGALIAVPLLNATPQSAPLTGQVVSTCRDSDFGKAYSRYGIVSGGVGVTREARDMCTGEGADNILFEYYCENDQIQYSKVVCSKGCYDGACIDGTLEPVETACTDTDGGKDFGVKGSVIGSDGGEKAEDICGTEGGTVHLYEYFCDENRVQFVTKKCESGCAEGRCLDKPKGVCGDGVIDVDEDCDDGVDNGKASSLCTTSCQRVSCSDTDGGVERYKKGSVRSGIGQVNRGEDICLDTRNVQEKFCEGDMIKSVRLECQFGCDDGACKTDDTLTPAPRAGFEDEVRVTSAAPKRIFSDVDPSSQLNKVLSYLIGDGVVGGFSDGTFKPYNTVNRAEAAKFLVRAKLGDDVDLSVTSTDGTFSDVPDGEWYVPYIMEASRLGVINGHPDGTFRPQDPVNVAEFLKMSSLIFGFGPAGEPLEGLFSDISDDNWFMQYAHLAINTLEEDVFQRRMDGMLHPAHALTRGEVAFAIRSFMQRDERF